MPDGALTSPLPHAGDQRRSILPLSARNLRVTRNGRTLLDLPQIAIAGQGLTVVMGPNGAGKSLLLRILAGLVEPDRGQVSWGGATPDRRQRTRLGYVFQKPVLLRRSALANVTYPLKAAGLPRVEARERARKALEQARLEHLAERPARVLSGGEQQRLALARALALEPEVLFLDEPTASLDPASTLAIEEMARTARRGGTRLVLVSHDPAQARRLADEVIFLHHGQVLERGPAEAFFDRPQSREAQAYLAGEILL